MSYVFFIFLNYAIWSLSFPLGRYAVASTTPLFLTAGRMFLAGIMLLGYSYYKNGKLSIHFRDLLPLFLLGIFAMYASNALEFYALKHLTSVKVCFLYSFSPLISAGLSYMQLKEKITKKKWVGLLIGFAGFFPMLMAIAEGSEGDLGGLGILSWPEIAVIAAVVAAMYGWVLLRQLTNKHKMDVMTANGFAMMLGAILAAGHSFCVDDWAPFPVYDYYAFFEGVILITLISNLICYNFYGWLLKHYTATFLSFAGLSMPFFTAFFGWLLLGEVVGIEYFLSMFIICIGLWIVHAEELRLGYISHNKKEEGEEAPCE